MATALLLSIHSQDIVGAIFTVAWLLIIAVVLFLDQSFKHGWFIPSDEAEREYREKAFQVCP